MPTRRFDGADLDAALARARAEVGSGARVLSAERVRSGGLGGFFAKERVEIEVEVGDDDAPVVLIAEPDPTPGSLLDLVDLVSRAEHHDARAAIRPDRVEIVRHLAVDEDTDRRPPAPPPPTAATPPQAPAPHAPAAPAAAPVSPAPAAAPVSPAPPAPTVSTESTTFAEILDRITAQTAAPVPQAPPVVVEPDAAAPVDVSPVPSADAAGALARFDAASARAEASGPARAPMRLISTPGTFAAALPPLPAPSNEPGPLTRLGLPPELEPDGADLREALMAQLATLPLAPALPSSRGTVVAVVGPRGLAHHVARTICVRVGTDPGSITTLTARRAHASDPELTSVDEVTDNRRAWRRRTFPTVAVIDAPLGRPTAWVAEVLGALEPTAVWGVVEASRKVEDLTAWSSDLGGLDALCLTGLDDTVSPATPLRTGIPVALLEGQPATPDRWADLLLTRLAS